MELVISLALGAWIALGGWISCRSLRREYREIMNPEGRGDGKQ